MTRNLLATGFLAAAFVAGCSLYVRADIQRGKPSRPPAQSEQPAKPAEPAPDRHGAGPNAPDVGKATPRTTPHNEPRDGRRVRPPLVAPSPDFDFGFWYGYPFRMPYRHPAPYPWYVFPESRLGSVRLDVDQKDASVYVDGYYAGVVNDFDGIFQHLALRVGPHEIEMRKDGFEALCVDVNVRPWQTLTYRGEMRPLEAIETP